MKTGFVNIFGRPNAGKSTLLNALMGEKMAIVSAKVQTTRHRIKTILTEKDYQVVLSDTPGIIEPKYKLHEKMMQAVKGALEDADVALLIVDVNENWEESNGIFEALRLKVPSIVVINKIDRAPEDKIKEAVAFFESKKYCKSTITISAASGINIKRFLKPILALLPEGEPYYAGDEITDLPTKFFVSELVREKIYELLSDEIPYQTTVLIREFKEENDTGKDRGGYHCAPGNTESDHTRGKRKYDQTPRHRSQKRDRSVLTAKDISGVVCKSKTKVAGE